MTCYPIPGKPKARLLCEAFAGGVAAAGGTARVCEAPPARLRDGAAVFYGVRPAVAHLWAQARDERRDWFYIDNAYFDRARERCFRVTENALQADGLQACWEEDGAARLAALGVELRPWRISDGEWRMANGGSDNRHVVVCPQSEEFMQVVAGWSGNWLEAAVAVLRRHTDRPLVIRGKGERRPLAQDLRGAWALVTHMSAAAIEALVAGVPVFCTGRCPAQWMGTSDLAQIERPLYPERREAWAQLLAANQWTLDEIRSGRAWRAFEAQRERSMVHL